MDICVNQIFTGRPKTVGSNEAASLMDREWTSAIFKEPAEEPVWAGKTGLAGDDQADKENHGGPEKAIFAYPLEHYEFWQKEHGVANISAGGMGENFSMGNVSEGQISIGDTFQIGEAIIQVSQPRQPCWKPARRFKVKTLALLIQNTGRTGWYFRVLQEGFVEAGQSFTLLDRPYPQWTIQKCNEVLHSKNPDYKDMEKLSQCELLTPKMRNTLAARLEKRELPDISKRVYGPND